MLLSLNSYSSITLPHHVSLLLTVPLLTTLNPVYDPGTLSWKLSGLGIGEMTAFAKRSVVDSLVTFLAHMESITFSHAGRLFAAPESAGVLKQSLLTDADRMSLSMQTRGFKIRDRGVEPKMSLCDLLSSLLDAQLGKEEPKDESNVVRLMWSKSSQILGEMKSYGLSRAVTMGSAQFSVSLGLRTKEYLGPPEAELGD